MSDDQRFVSIGRVGRPHGRDGSFYVDDPSHSLPVGLEVRLGGVPRRIERRGGTDTRPLVRLSGLGSRDEISRLRGQPLLARLEEAPLAGDEWLVEDLVGCTVPGLGEVRRVLEAPSCDLLEVGPEGVLIPLVSDAVVKVDLAARRIEVDAAFLGLNEGAGDA